MNMFCLIPRALHNESINAMPSSCIYKLFQNSNYEIGDYFYDESIAQNHAFKFQCNFHKCLNYICNILMY
jgi:hypothetical protein